MGYSKKRETPETNAVVVVVGGDGSDAVHMTCVFPYAMVVVMVTVMVMVWVGEWREKGRCWLLVVGCWCVVGGWVKRVKWVRWVKMGEVGEVEVGEGEGEGEEWEEKEEEEGRGGGRGER